MESSILMGGSSKSKEEKRTLPGVELGLKVKEVLSPSNNASTFHINDRGRVIVTHQSPAPRGLRQIYTREAEFLVRQLAEDIEQRIAAQAEADKKNEELSKELEELKVRHQELNNALNAMREKHTREVEELREEVRVLSEAQGANATELDNTRHLLSLLEALLSDSHTLFELEYDQQSGLFNIGLSGISLVYEPQRPELTVHSRPGVDHPIKPQVIELDGTQPTEAGLAFISTLSGIVFDPMHTEVTEKWSKERLDRLFVPRNKAPGHPTLGSDVEVYHVPGLQGIIRKMDILSIGAAVEDSADPADEVLSSTDSVAPAPDPTANWTSSTQ